MKKFLYRFFLFFFAGVFLVSAFMLGRYWLNSKQNDDQYNDLAEQVAQIQAQQTQPVPDDSDVPEVTDTTEPVQAPVSGGERRILPEYAPLYEQNSDMVGWIQIPNTKINYPVMQTPSNPDYYLKHSFEKTWSDYGVPYVDAGCTVGVSNNLIIYGHNMKNGTMFHDLVNYTKKDFYEAHPVICFDTVDAPGRYHVIAAFRYNTNKETFVYNEHTDMDEAEFTEYVENCRARSIYDTGFTAEYGDQLITLSTCEYTYTNGRFVVVAKKIVE
jgi:sortase B